MCKWFLFVQFYFICKFQIQGEQLFSSIDKEGLEHAMTLPNSACDNNDPIWKVDTLKVSDKGKLPIKVSIFQNSVLSRINSNLTLNEGHKKICFNLEDEIS